MNWKLDKLERKSSFNLFQGLVAQVDTTLGIDSLASSTIPDSLLIDPASGQQTIVIDFDSGNDPQLEDLLGDSTCVLPPEWKWTAVLSVIHLLDRGSVGRGTVRFGSTAGRLNWVFAWGQNHDEWNAVRVPATTIQSGRIWKSVVKFSGIANIPAGPYRSGAWGQQRREIHGKQVQGLLSKDHPEFIESAQKQFELDARAYYDEWLDDYSPRFCSLRCVHLAPPIIKLARWGSICNGLEVLPSRELAVQADAGRQASWEVHWTCHGRCWYGSVGQRRCCERVEGQGRPARQGARQHLR